MEFILDHHCNLLDSYYICFLYHRNFAGSPLPLFILCCCREATGEFVFCITITLQDHHYHCLCSAVAARQLVNLFFVSLQLCRITTTTVYALTILHWVVPFSYKYNVHEGSCAALPCACTDVHTHVRTRCVSCQTSFTNWASCLQGFSAI